MFSYCLCICNQQRHDFISDIHNVHTLGDIMQTLELLFLRFNCQAVSLGLLNFRIRFITIRDSINKHEFIHSPVSHVKSQQIQHLVGQSYVVINEHM